MQAINLRSGKSARKTAGYHGCCMAAVVC
jgi:hypothetical protein